MAEQTPFLLSLIKKNQKETYNLARAIDLVCDIINDHTEDIAAFSSVADRAFNEKPKINIQKVIEYRDPPKIPDLVSVSTVQLVDGDLVVHLTDGEQINCGSIINEEIANRIDVIESALKKRVVTGGGGGNAKRLLKELNENDVTPVSATFTYNGDGTLATQTKAGIVNTFSYNVDGSLASIANSDTTRTYAYDGQGNLTSITVV